MAKRAAPKRRQTRKVVGFHQSTPRRRAEKNSNRVRRSAHNRRAFEVGRVKTASESVSASSETNSQELLSTKIANETDGSALPNYARALASPKPFLQGQPVERRSFMVQSPSVVRNGMLALMRELTHHGAQQVHHNLQAMNALVGCRSPLDFFRVQTDLALGTLENIVRSASRSSLFAIQMSTEAARLSFSQFSRSE